MDLKNHQAIALVHRGKQHTHIYIYADRISLKGEVYKDSFIGKRSQIAADNIAQQLGLTRVREVQQEKPGAPITTYCGQIPSEIKRLYQSRKFRI